MRHKLLLVLIDNLAMGGGQNVVLELIKNVDTTKYFVKVLCYGRKRGTSIESQLKTFCDVQYMNIQGHINLLSMIKVLRKISEINPDIIHAHLGGITFGLPWCLLHKKPIVVTAHTIPEKAFSKNNERLLRFGLKHGKVILVAVSKENYIRCKKYFSINSNTCRLVNNGVDKTRFYSVTHDEFVFINVATHNENKNQKIILEAFSRLSCEKGNIRLILVGDGPTHDYLVDLAQSLNISNLVEFPGCVNNPEDYYSRSDVYIQSSHREAMPMSVLESMMARIPVIATNVGGLADVVNGNGYLIKDNDVDDLYWAMKRLINMNYIEMEKMKAQSRRIAEEYSSDNMAVRYMEIFDEMMS